MVSKSLRGASHTRSLSSRAIVLLGTSALSLVAAKPAISQTVPATSAATGEGQTENSTALADIVVTARRVAEKLQDVPLSVTALSSANLSDAKISQVLDLKAQISNVNVNKTSVAGAAFVAIRGLNSGQLPNIELDNRVGIYLDGVYIARSQGGSFTLADIDRLEVLKGPQGTLFGRNVTAGALNFVTSNPTGTFGGVVEAGFGNFARQRYRISIDLPAFAGFSVKLGYVHDQNHGDTRNAAAGRQYGAFVNAAADYNIVPGRSAKRFGGLNNESVFAAVRYEGIDGLTADYKFDYAENIDSVSGGQSIGYAGNFVGCSGAVLAFGLAYNCAAANPAGVDTSAAALTSSAANNVPVSFDKLHTLAQDLTNPNRLHNWGHSLTLDYSASDALSLKAITGYRGVRTKTVQDLDGGDIYINNAVLNGTATFLGLPAPLPATGITPYCLSCAVQTQKQHQFSQEVQLLGHFDTVDLLGGLYYFHERGVTRNFYVANFNPVSSLFGFGLLPLSSSVNNVPDFGFSNGDLATARATSRAVFGRVTWHATDRLDLVAGARYTQDRKHNTISAVLAKQVDTDPTTPAIEEPPLDARVGFNKFTYEGTATYKVTSDVNVFARYTTAYLSGGLLRNVAFKPETASDIELGLKSEWFDRRLRFNLTGFSQRSKNLQVNTSLPPVGTLVVINVGTAKTKGFEAELTAVPMEGLTLGTNVGYTHQDYSNGSRNLAPSWTLQLSAGYEAPKFSNGSYLQFNVDGNYSSKWWGTQESLAGGANVDGTALPPQVIAGFANQQDYLRALDKAATNGGYWLANARLSLADIPLGATKARLSGYVRNIFNEQHVSYATNYGTQVLAFFEPDRSYGVDLRFEF